MNLLKLSFILLFLFSFTTQANSGYRLYRPWAKTLNDSAYQLQAQTDYFVSSGAYDIDGNEVSFEDDESFSVIDGQLKLSYGLGNELELYGGLRVRMINTSYNLNSEQLSTSKSGLESYFAGLRYELGRSGALLYALNIGVRKTAYTNSNYVNTSDLAEDEVILGDSGMSVHAGVALSYLSASDHYYNGAIAYQKPGNDLSDELYYEIGSAWTWETIALNLGVEGIYSMSTSIYSDTPSDRPIQGRAPSNLYNSINRSYTAPKVELYSLFGNWRVSVGLKQVMSGMSTDKGTTFSIGLTKESGGVSNNEIKKSAFKEYTIEGTVLKVSPRGKFVQIDQGLGQDVTKGITFDIYQTDFFGGNELVATAVVYEVSAERSILRIVKKYTSKRVKKGFTARAK